MSLPAPSAASVCRAGSAVKRWMRICVTAPQSETTKPSKPHSPRSVSVSRPRCATAGVPFTQLNELMTVRAPARTPASNGGRYHSRRARGEMSV